MPTVQQLAAEIDKLQPDLKEFWQLTNLEQTVVALTQQPYSALNAFKLELLMCYAVTNSRIYTNNPLRDTYINYANRYNLPVFQHGIQAVTSAYSKLQVFELKANRVGQEYLIINNVAHPRKYMNAYLKGIGSTSVSTAINKNLEPNEMSLVVFTSWLDSTKSLNSVQALAFIKQIQPFGSTSLELQSKFLDAILSHCPKPSIELQRIVADNYYRQDPKYPSITRDKVRNEIDNNFILAFPSIHSEQGSTFKPFVANLTTAPVITAPELSSLLSIALMLLQRTNPLTQSEQVYLTSLIAYINIPGHSELLTPLKDSLHSTQRTITSLLDSLS